MLNYTHNFQTDNNDFFYNDVWCAEDIGINPNHTASMNKLYFAKLKPDWLKTAVKQFVRLQAATRTISTCRTYITSLVYFGTFITQQFNYFQAKNINRSLVIEYLCYVKKLNLKPASQRSLLINLRTFLECCANEDWLPISKERMIADRDLPFLPEPVPRYIPEYVMQQLEANVDKLPSPFNLMIRVFMETGRRAGELCVLPFNCLTFDQENDPFISSFDAKTKKEITIPISKMLAEKIQLQQKDLAKYGLDTHGYLFFHFKNKNNHYTVGTVNRVLKDLGKKFNIKAADGTFWNFTTHQFRHTVGTRMINTGVPQHIVQKYLGHESPEMTSRYAKIHDRTMKEAFQTFQTNMVDIHGKSLNYGVDCVDSQWLKNRVKVSSLSNGFCRLSLKQPACPHANACLTCTNFCTTKEHLPQHKKQLMETMRLIDEARNSGLSAQLESNEKIKTNLLKIISRLTYDN